MGIRQFFHNLVSSSETHHQPDWITDFVRDGEQRVRDYNEHRADRQRREEQQRQAREGVSALRREQEKALFTFFFDRRENVPIDTLTKIETLLIQIKERDEYLADGNAALARVRDYDIQIVIRELEALRDGMRKIEWEIVERNPNILRIPQRA